MYSIGTLAKRTKVKVPTIRYYEEIGLLPEPERNTGGQRRYDNATKHRLNFVRHARDLGFSIEHIRSLLSLSERPDMPCAEAHRIAKAHLSDIQSKINALTLLADELVRISNHSEIGVLGECNVLASLADHAHCLTEH